MCLPVSLGFFDDILIPPESLQQPAKLYPPKVRVGHRGALGGPQAGPGSGGLMPLASASSSGLHFALGAPAGLCVPHGPWCFHTCASVWAVRPGSSSFA